MSPQAQNSKAPSLRFADGVPCRPTLSLTPYSPYQCNHHHHQQQQLVTTASPQATLANSHRHAPTPNVQHVVVVLPPSSINGEGWGSEPPGPL